MPMAKLEDQLQELQRHTHVVNEVVKATTELGQSGALLQQSAEASSRGIGLVGIGLTLTALGLGGAVVYAGDVQHIQEVVGTYRDIYFIAVGSLGLSGLGLGIGGAITALRGPSRQDVRKLMDTAQGRIDRLKQE